MNYKITPILYGRNSVGNTWSLFPPKGMNRLYYIHGGKTRLQIGNTVITPRQGAYYFISQNLEIIPFFEETEAFDHSYVDFLSIPAPYSDGIIELLPESNPMLYDAAHIIPRIIGDLSFGYHSDERRKLVASYLNNLIYLLSREFPIKQHEDNRLITVLEYIANHYHEPIAIQTLADLCYMSPNYFIGYFGERMNLSPYQYIKNYRLEQSVSMLQSGLSIKQISEAIGYENVSSFSTSFKKKYGVSPSEMGE